MIPIGVWVPIDSTASMPPPGARPLGRAALAARERGLEVIFGDRLEDGVLHGVLAHDGHWQTVARRVVGIHDRYPGQSRAAQWDRLHHAAQQAQVRVGNSRAATLLCRDKLACQRVLEAAGVVGLPPVESRPDHFSARLAQWGGAFAKPRSGALGAGVRFVVPGDHVPASLPTVVAGRRDPALLQWAVPAPPGVAGRVLRVLVQRVGGGFVCRPAVLRQSATDPVVNVARGAGVTPAEDALDEGVLDTVYQRVTAVARAIDGAAPGVVELGVDVALDPCHNPWVIEVNTRPRGRLRVLARDLPDRFETVALDAALAPWLALAVR